jgi:hypothetical protein
VYLYRQNLAFGIRLRKDIMILVVDYVSWFWLVVAEAVLKAMLYNKFIGL